VPIVMEFRVATEQIPEINEFLSWQMPDDPGNDDDDPEEQEKNSQDELIN
jgi:hypothetical protein